MEILHPGYQPLCLQYGDDYSREPDCTVSPNGRYGVCLRETFSVGVSWLRECVLQDQHTGKISLLSVASTNLWESRVVWSADSSRVAVLGICEGDDDDDRWVVSRVMDPDSDADSPATRLVYCVRTPPHVKKIVFDPTLLRSAIASNHLDQAETRLEIYNLHTLDVSVEYPTRAVSGGNDAFLSSRTTFAWTPCGKWVAVACLVFSPDRAIVWIADAKTGRMVCNSLMIDIRIVDILCFALDFSPDGKLLVLSIHQSQHKWTSVWRVPSDLRSCDRSVEPDRYCAHMDVMGLPVSCWQPEYRRISAIIADELFPQSCQRDPAVPRLKLELSMAVDPYHETYMRRVSWRCPGVLSLPVKDINKSITVAIPSDLGVSIMSHIARTPGFLAHLGPHVCSIVRLMLWVCVYRDRGSLQPWLSRLPTELFHHILSFMLCLPRCVVRARLLR